MDWVSDAVYGCQRRLGFEAAEREYAEHRSRTFSIAVVQLLASRVCAQLAEDVVQKVMGLSSLQTLSSRGGRRQVLLQCAPGVYRLCSLRLILPHLLSRISGICSENLPHVPSLEGGPRQQIRPQF